MSTKIAAKTDKQTQLDVLAALARDLRFKPAEIGVEVDAGVVTLTGTVSSYPKLGLAAEIAGNVPGVKDVANDLMVIVARDDTRIAQAVRDALEWDVTVPDARIDSVVRRGVVTLKGTVDFWYERQAAADVISTLLGVVCVNNHIVIAPPKRSDAAMTEEISEVLRRQFPMSELNVFVDRHVARLSGPVYNVETRRAAERIAWSTPGIKSVINNIEIMF